MYITLVLPLFYSTTFREVSFNELNTDSSHPKPPTTGFRLL